jgi:hypothetical protein
MSDTSVSLPPFFFKSLPVHCAFLLCMRSGEGLQVEAAIFVSVIFARALPPILSAAMHLCLAHVCLPLHCILYEWQAVCALRFSVVYEVRRRSPGRGRNFRECHLCKGIAACTFGGHAPVPCARVFASPLHFKRMAGNSIQVGRVAAF